MSDSPWLLIFDNADDSSLLKHVWPNNSNGSVIITSRDANFALHFAARGVQIRPLDEATSVSLLLKILSIEEASSVNRERIHEIAGMFAGLPLALTQIGSFIAQRKLSLQDFPSYYKRNSLKIDSRKSKLSEYEHTLDSVWAMSLETLPNNAACLARLLSLFNPDSVKEEVLVRGCELVDDDLLSFLEDEME